MEILIFILILFFIIWKAVPKKVKNKTKTFFDKNKDIFFVIGGSVVILVLVVLGIFAIKMFLGIIQCGKEAINEVQKISATVAEVKLFRKYIENGTISGKTILPNVTVGSGKKYFYKSQRIKEYRINNFFGNVEVETTTNRSAVLYWEIVAESQSNELMHSIKIKYPREKNRLTISSELKEHSIKENNNEFFLKLLVSDGDLNKWRQNLFPGKYRGKSNRDGKYFNFIKSFQQLKATVAVNMKLRCPEKSTIIINNFIGDIKIKGNVNLIRTHTFIGNVFLSLSTQKNTKNKVTIDFGNLELSITSPLKGDYEINNNFVGRTIVYLPKKSSYRLKAVTNLTISDPNRSESLFSKLAPFSIFFGKIIGFAVNIDPHTLFGLARIKSDIPFLYPEKNINQRIDTSIGGGKNNIVINSGFGNVYITSSFDE